MCADNVKKLDIRSIPLSARSPATDVGTPALPVMQPFDYIVFGGTGDLAQRKLLPALYHRDRDGQLPEAGRIIAVSRGSLTKESYRNRVGDPVRAFIGDADFDPDVWTRFMNRLDYVQADATTDSGWPELASRLDTGDDRVRVFYLATAPRLFGPICERLAQEGLVTPQARVVVEKPIGHDLDSARQINEAIGAVFDEDQIYRIDHYLGKETVQNLLALRFANSLFEPLWNNRYIDHVQITVAESVGVGDRGGYYDQAGALRDMVQNHLLQLLCLVAMEPPTTLTSDTVRDEKLKVLKSLRPIQRQAVLTQTVRGQYRAGAVNGAPVPGYLDELGEGALSVTETFVAIKAQIDSWRWAGVPFYLRTGKRLPTKVSEIIIQFRPIPCSIFPEEAGRIEANRLVMRLQPDEAIRMVLMTKEPGPGGIRLRPAPLNLSFAETFKRRFPDAYERLLLDVVRGNPTLFMRRDEVEQAWIWTEQILDGWDLVHEAPKPYAAGTWGPNDAIAMIVRDERTWHDESGLMI